MVRISVLERRIRVFVVAMYALLAGVAAGAQPSGTTSFLLDRDVIEVPFEYKEHEILISGAAGDHTDLTFMFDSGASSVVLDRSLGSVGRHVGDTLIQEAQGETRAESIWLDIVRVGPAGTAASARGIGGLVTSLSHLSKVVGRRIDGIVGITFIAGFVTEIDYQKRVLRFHRPADFQASAPTRDHAGEYLLDLIPSDPRKPVPTAMVKGLLRPDSDYLFLVDTGYGGYAGIAHAAAQRAGLIRDDMPRVVGNAYSVSRSFQTEKIRAGYLKIGDLDLSNRVVSVDHRNNDPIGQPGIIGNQLLQNFLVTLDYGRHRLSLVRTVIDEEPDEAERPSLGLMIRSDHSVIRVAHVTLRSPALYAGLRPGDRLVAIGNQVVMGLSVARVANLLAAAQGDVQLQWERGIDPNLGVGGELYTRNVKPASPFDWKSTDWDVGR